MDFYTERKTTIINLFDIKSIRECKTEELVLSYQENGRTLKKDFGNLCYSMYKKPTCRGPAKVVQSSFQESRCSVLKEALLAYVTNNNHPQSVKKTISNFYQTT